MIIIDTNVLSEEMKPVPAASVLAWFRQQSAVDLFTTAVCQAEILLGVAMLPNGRRKFDLEAVARSVLGLFVGRILPFDSAAAATYAEIVAARQKVGRPINDFDAQIAAIARSRDMALATRNGSDFEGIGLHIINPWAE
jgi:predicted nucleic acid-binding protein